MAAAAAVAKGWVARRPTTATTITRRLSSATKSTAITALHSGASSRWATAALTVAPSSALGILAPPRRSYYHRATHGTVSVTPRDDSGPSFLPFASFEHEIRMAAKRRDFVTMFRYWQALRESKIPLKVQVANKM